MLAAGLGVSRIGHRFVSCPTLQELVEGAPKTVKENLPKADAEQLMKKLAEAGAKVKMD